MPEREVGERGSGFICLFSFVFGPPTHTSLFFFSEKINEYGLECKN